jgi:hypothetical protein
MGKPLKSLVTGTPIQAPVLEDKARALHQRFTRAVALKNPWLSTFEECFEYALPAKESMFLQADAKRRTDKIFDETAVVGVQEFASRLQAGIMPTFSRWADLKTGTDIPDDQRKEADAALDAVTEHVFEILQHSNMDQEISESFLDLAVGTATIDIIESDDPIAPIRFAAVPIAHLYIDSGPDDRVDFIARKREMTADQIKLRYRGAKTVKAMAEEKAEGEGKLRIVEACERDWSKPVETWTFTVYEEGECETIFTETESGIGSGRFICFRWAKLGGEVWGRGPLLNALPAIKTCNLTVELILENAEMAITGLYTAEDDGTMNVDTIQLLPGTIIPTMPGSGGLKAVQAAGKFDVSQMILTEMRSNIKKALYNDSLGNPDKTPASATEISARMADLSRQIGAAFGRLQNELVQPLIQRVIYILKKQGRIKLPSVNGREVKVSPTSPLSQAQAHQDVTTTSQYIGMLGQLFGPQLVNLLVDTTKAADYLADKLKINSQILRTEAGRQAIMQQMSQAIGQQQNQPQDPNAPAGQPAPAGAPGG